MKFRLVITLNLLLAAVFADICPFKTDDFYGDLGSSVVLIEDSAALSMTEIFKISEIRATFINVSGSNLHDIDYGLVRIEIDLTNDASLTLFGDNQWFAEVDDYDDLVTNNYDEHITITIDPDRTIVGWEQTYRDSGSGKFATGFILHMDDGTEIESNPSGHDTIYTSYGIQWIRGPLRGIYMYTGTPI